MMTGVIFFYGAHEHIETMCLHSCNIWMTMPQMPRPAANATLWQECGPTRVHRGDDATRPNKAFKQPTLPAPHSNPVLLIAFQSSAVGQVSTYQTPNTLCEQNVPVLSERRGRGL